MEFRDSVRNAIVWLIDNREGGSASAFGRRISRSRQRVHSWKKGEFVPDLDTIVEIGSAYDVSLDWLIGGDESKAPEDFTSAH